MLLVSKSKHETLVPTP